ncbi:hypothetical protein ACLOJK_021449 [Asimina triloba]
MGGGGPYRDHETMTIRKGPWMAEEDEILMDFVKKHGPRDWSSIRSTGLLPRTGKSCRLRWVNKLKPDLKTGCKFSAEEEKLVIDLQAQFGNKWARIATYLPGRTDNDVKNFWSTRQKRLARILQASPSSSKSKKNYGKVPIFSEVSTPSSSIQFEEDFSNGECSEPSFMGSSDAMKLVHLPDLVKPHSLDLETGIPSLELKATEDKQFQRIPPSPFTYPLLDLPQFTESQGLLLPEFSNTDFLNTFTCQDCLAPESGGFLFSPWQSTKRGDGAKTPDRFFDDLPADMLNCFEPFPSSSHW